MLLVFVYIFLIALAAGFIWKLGKDYVYLIKYRPVLSVVFLVDSALIWSVPLIDYLAKGMLFFSASCFFMYFAAVHRKRHL